MNRLCMTMALLMIFIVPQAQGATSPYPNPYRQTTWNNITDGMHTIGQNPHQAALTKKKLHKARTSARIRSINNAKKQTWMNSHN